MAALSLALALCTAEPQSQSQSAAPLCFVTSLLAKDPRTAEVLASVDRLGPPSRYRYYVYSNLAAHEIPGGLGNWTLVPMAAKMAGYNRTITASRWPKFMAWTESPGNECGVIAYADANWAPDLSAVGAAAWRRRAAAVAGSEVGLMQTSVRSRDSWLNLPRSPPLHLSIAPPPRSPTVPPLPHRLTLHSAPSTLPPPLCTLHPPSIMHPPPSTYSERYWTLGTTTRRKCRPIWQSMAPSSTRCS